MSRSEDDLYADRGIDAGTPLDGSHCCEDDQLTSLTVKAALSDYPDEETSDRGMRCCPKFSWAVRRSGSIVLIAGCKNL